jgi:hypothetical protein
LIQINDAALAFLEMEKQMFFFPRANTILARSNYERNHAANYRVTEAEESRRR